MIPIDLTGKTVLITGCDSPEASRVARRFALAGANLIIQYQEKEESSGRLAEGINLAGGRAETFYADLGKYQEAERLTDKIIERYKTIDVLVNAAGRPLQVPFRELTPEQWNESLQQNLFRVYHISSCISRLMTEGGRRRREHYFRGPFFRPGRGRRFFRG